MAEKEYIKREDAYTTLTDYYHHSTEIQHMALKEALDRVPAADVVKRKTGKWILHKDGSATCSECDFYQSYIWDLDDWQNYCGICGAKMTEAMPDAKMIGGDNDGT